ncbi:MAG TPA: PAS domain S-box protein [Bryobacteraceae bacterium]
MMSVLMDGSEFTQKSDFKRYALALASTAAAVLIRLLFQPLLGSRLPFSTVFLTLLAGTRFWGVGPSVLLVLGGTLGCLAVTGTHDLVTIVGFVVASFLAIWIVEALRRAHRQAEESARLAEERLRQLHEDSARRAREAQISAQFRAVVESSADAIISKDLNGIIQSWNHGAEQIFGYSAAEAIGRSISILVPPDRAQEQADITEQLRRGREVTHFETFRCRKDGVPLEVSLTISPIRDLAGNVVGISDIARDITERKALEEQLRQTQKLESLGVLAGGLAHDFNNLLTGIMGNASLALHEPGAEPASSMMHEILRASERAALLVGQMLAYAGKGKYVVERLDLSAQVADIVPLIQSSVPRLVQLDLRLDRNLPAAEADRSQIQQIVMNLAINAVEAVGERTGIVTIKTYPRETDNEQQVVLEVNDTGCGMDEATKARIFEPFFTTKFTGRGLGLAAVLGIIQAHHGSISVESTPGQGTTFTVVLPAAATPASVATPEMQSDVRGYGSVLVVDDEELVRNLARFTLERYGYTVELACDGRSAVEAFSSHPGDFAAVLLDLTMPVMNGEETLRRMRAIRPAVPVVLSSGFSEVEAAERFRDSGVSGFLQKPYTPTALARKVKQAVKAAEL